MQVWWPVVREQVPAHKQPDLLPVEDDLEQVLLGQVSREPVCLEPVPPEQTRPARVRPVQVPQAQVRPEPVHRVLVDPVSEDPELVGPDKAAAILRVLRRPQALRSSLPNRS